MSRSRESTQRHGRRHAGASVERYLDSSLYSAVGVAFSGPNVSDVLGRSEDLIG